MRLWLILLLKNLLSCYSDPSSVISSIERLYRNEKLDIRARSKLFLLSKYPYELAQDISLHNDEINPSRLEHFGLNDSWSYFKQIDSPFNLWADVTHDSTFPFLNLDGYSAFLQSNPVHRRVDYAGDDIADVVTIIRRCMAGEFFRFIPYRVPCLSCQKNLTGSLAYVFINWNNFISVTPNSFRNEPFQETLFESAFSWLLRMSRDLSSSEYRAFYHTMLQLFSYSYTNFSPLLSDRGGRLQVLNLHLFANFLKFESAAKRNGVIKPFFRGRVNYQCLVDMDGSYLDTGVIVKVDHIPNHQKRIKYEQFESWSPEYKPYEDTLRNLKIDVSWRKFGCCSACCCTYELCGLYASMKNCKSVFSKKVRKGYLSIQKIDPNKQVSPEQLNAFFSVSPYIDEGIPLYSTLIDSLNIFGVVNEWRASFNSLNRITSYNGIGVYIEERSCANDPQKLNCFELAKCKGILLKSEEDEKDNQSDNDADPCADINMTYIIIKEGQSLYRVREGQNYRFQLDPSIFNTDRGVKWKISLDFVSNYRSKQDCLEQDRSVHPNGKDLLIIPLSRRDINKRIEAITLDGRKAQFELKSEENNVGDGWKTVTVVIWTALIFIFISLIMMFVVVVEGTKARRIQRILKHKEDES